ncbi:MAG: FAD-binding oxidoreductase [Pseudobacteriovorax sp.]|nr:FAD-binding oxidoreductase [Pseudobacteriovorax sp.]
MSLTQEADYFTTTAVAIVGNDHVIFDAAPYERNCSGFAVKVRLVIRPETKQQIEQIIQLANQESVLLHPISTGKNWGMGSKLPTSQDVVLLDLSRMTRIISHDDQLGLVEIEPGVTQLQLAEYLSQKGSRYFLDVTGSGTSTSIIGNTLERGVTYHRERAESVVSVEVVLGDGRVVKTGWCSENPSDFSQIYKHGIGPSLLGLFVQSNYGVVTSAVIQLMKKPSYQEAFLLSIPNDAAMLEVMAKLRDLKQELVLESIPHIANSRRREVTMSPALANAFPDLSRDEIGRILNKELTGEWSGIGSVLGDKKLVKQKLKVIRKSLKGLCTVKSFSEDTLLLSHKILSFFNLNTKKVLVESLLPTLKLALGTPDDSALKSIYWPITTKIDHDHTDPDQGKAGILFVAPIIPANHESIQALHRLVHETLPGFQPAITLNLISGYAIEAVISIDFDNSNSEQRDAAHRVIGELVKSMIADKIYPYRLDIGNMEKLKDIKNPYFQLQREIKTICDPKGIVSEGRYVV